MASQSNQAKKYFLRPLCAVSYTWHFIPRGEVDGGAIPIHKGPTGLREITGMFIMSVPTIPHQENLPSLLPPTLSKAFPHYYPFPWKY